MIKSGLFQNKKPPNKSQRVQPGALEERSSWFPLQQTIQVQLMEMVSQIYVF